MAEPTPTAPPGLVPIREDSGSISYVREADVQAAQAEGATRASAAEVDKDNYSRGLSGVGATADAFARGATFSASDFLQVEGARLLGGDAAASQMAAKTRLLKDNFADTTGLSELAGGFLLPIPGSGAAKGVGEGLAKGLAGAAERQFGKGALTFAAEHVLPGAITGLYEGGIMGAGSALSESALGDEAVTAEKLFAHASKGALFGGGLGGVLGGAAGAISERFGGKAAGLAGAVERQGVTDLESAMVRNEQRVAAPVAAEGKGVLSRIQSMADEEAYRSLGGGAKDYKLLNRAGDAEARLERAQGIGKLLRDEGIVTATATKAQMAERLAVKLEEAGQELGTMRKALDETGAKVAMQPILDRARAEVLEPVAAKVGFSSEASVVDSYIKEIAEKIGPETTFEKLHEMRKQLDSKMKYDQVSAPGAVTELRKIRAIVEDEFTKAGEAAAGGRGEQFAEKYNFAKQKYSMLADAERASVTGLDRKGVNRTVSLTDTIMGAGAFATMGPAGLLAAAGNKVVREFGSQAASVALNHLAGLEGVQRAAQAVDSLIARGVSDFTASVGKSAVKGASARRMVTPTQATEVARTVLTNPAAITSRITDFVGTKIAGVAPRTAESVTATATRAMIFLQKKAPHEPLPISPLQPNAGNRAPSRVEVAKFAKYVEAIDDPTVVVRGLQSGHLSREHVEAVKEVYPRLFAVMQGRLQDEIAKLPKQLPHPTLVALSVLFDAPMVRSMEPAVVRGLQAQYAPAKGGVGGPSKLHVPTPLNLAPILAVGGLQTHRIEKGA